MRIGADARRRLPCLLYDHGVSRPRCLALYKHDRLYNALLQVDIGQVEAQLTRLRFRKGQDVADEGGKALVRQLMRSSEASCSLFLEVPRMREIDSEARPDS